MEINKVNKMEKIGILASIVVIVSLLLSWIVVNIDLVGISETYTGFQLFELENFDYNLFPMIVMILGVLSVLYFYMDVKISDSASALIGIALGLGIVVLSYLTYNDLSNFAFNIGGVEIVTVNMGFGLLAAIIGGAVIIVTAVMKK